MHTLRSGYRIGCWPWWRHWLSVYTYINWVKFYYQRATRGWADCDTWSLDNYLAEWLPDALRHLKAHKHGTPISMFPNEPGSIDENGNPTDAAHAIASAHWDAAMDKMIAAFEAHQRMGNGLYEEELGPYPLREIDDWSKQDEDMKERHAKSVVLERRDMEIFKEGMALFAEHFGSLWD